jgi:hypothetical protein
MHTRILLTALALLPLLAIRADAQSFTLKKKDFPSAGKSVLVTDTETTRSAITLMLNGNAVFNEKKVEVGVKQFTEKVLVAGDKKPNKYTWTFTRATKGKEGEQANLSYAGKTITFDRQDGKYKVTSDGDGVDAKDLDTFTKEANHPDYSAELLPQKAVKVSDTWTIDKKAASALLGDIPEDALDLSKSTTQGKLVKVYKKGNEQRGVIELTFTGFMKKFGPATLDTSIEMKLKATFDTTIDGTSTLRTDSATFTVKGRSEFTQNNMTFLLDISIEGEFRREVGAEK